MSRLVLRPLPSLAFGLVIAAWATAAHAQAPAAREALWKKLEPYAQPP